MGIPLVLVVVDTTLQATLQPSGTLFTDLLMMDPDTGYLVQSPPYVTMFIDDVVALMLSLTGCA